MRDLIDLPNQDKFIFVGIDKDGNKHKCIIKKTFDGIKYTG